MAFTSGAPWAAALFRQPSVARAMRRAVAPTATCSSLSTGLHTLVGGLQVLPSQLPPGGDLAPQEHVGLLQELGPVKENTPYFGVARGEGGRKRGN